MPRGAFIGAAAAIALLGGAVFELRTCTIESWLLARSAAQLSYVLGPGPSPSIVFPRSGPIDRTRGYTQLADIEQRMLARGYSVREQVRFSPQLERLARLGISPPYRDSVAGGMKVLDADGAPLHGVDRPLFGRFEEIPPLVVAAASFIEDRQLLGEDGKRQNPVVNWGRLAVAGVSYTGRKLGFPMRLQGGSTLATQMEKYMHSPGGRTTSPLEKVRQMAGASLRVYREGQDTRERRREILADYIDTIPLGAAPGYGEVWGLAEGLHAWFGTTVPELRRDLSPEAPPEARASAFKKVLALLCAVRAPTFYLREDRHALALRADLYGTLMAESGLLDASLAARLPREPIPFRPSRSTSAAVDKASSIARLRLVELLGAPSLYELDRLHAAARTTLDQDLARQTNRVLAGLSDPAFLAEHGLYGERMLSPRVDPSKVVYTVMLYERTPAGDVLRVSTDSSGQPFDLNTGMKLELGSTAKLRTLAHYLEVMAGLHGELSLQPKDEVRRLAQSGRDPLTKLAAGILVEHPDATVEDVLAAALERKYSAAPWEAFFTAGGSHVFGNFDELDDYRVLSVREASVRSTNLVFIRLMRDLVRYHTARLPYDADEILGNPESPARRRMLADIAAREGRASARREGRPQPSDMSWLFRTEIGWARESRLRARIERDAFERMTPAWRRLGFPFATLVPSLATSIGSSGDRPAALAELMGIIAGGGLRPRPLWLTELRFGPGTPYETAFRPAYREPERVLPEAVARALRSVLVGVVEHGTARRAAGALRESDGTLVTVGGKTGSGDNRAKRVGRGGGLLGSVAYNRTAAFAFFAGDRYYGVLTATVNGPEAARYQFTSALPVTLLTLLAPALNERLAAPPVQPWPTQQLLVKAGRPLPPRWQHRERDDPGGVAAAYAGWGRTREDAGVSAAAPAATAAARARRAAPAGPPQALALARPALP